MSAPAESVSVSELIAAMETMLRDMTHIHRLEEDHATGTAEDGMGGTKPMMEMCEKSMCEPLSEGEDERSFVSLSHYSV